MAGSPPPQLLSKSFHVSLATATVAEGKASHTYMELYIYTWHTAILYPNSVDSVQLFYCQHG